MQLRISDVIHALLKRRNLIIILTAAGLAIGILLSLVSYMRGEMSKEYAVTTSFAVTSTTKDGLFTSMTSTPGSNDIYLAENMVDSVMYVIKSDKTLNAAIQRLNLLGITTRDINRNLTVKQYNETQIVEMTLYWRSAEEGVQILSSINAVAPAILIETLKIGGVSVVNDPTARYLVGGSVNASMWGYMALLGLLAGVGIAVLGLLLQPTLVNPRDADRVLGLEVLGEISDSKAYFSRRRMLLADEDGGGDPAVQEQFTSAAHILKNRLGAEHQCLYVTSAAANEGKTAVAANLAVQLADLERKVLLIDFDVHNPSLGSMFLEKVEYSHSLNALYRGEATEQEAITHLTGYLDLLPSILEHKSLPLDEAMLSLIRRLSEGYDYVLMDTAPIGRVADMMNLNRIASSALFVIRYDMTSMNEIREALTRMDKSGIRIAGCVVNGVKRMGRPQYAGYHGGKSARSRSAGIVPDAREDCDEEAVRPLVGLWEKEPAAEQPDVPADMPPEGPETLAEQPEDAEVSDGIGLFDEETESVPEKKHKKKKKKDKAAEA